MSVLGLFGTLIVCSTILVCFAMLLMLAWCVIAWPSEELRNGLRQVTTWWAARAQSRHANQSSDVA
jgi:hypothetical protein